MIHPLSSIRGLPKWGLVLLEVGCVLQEHPLITHSTGQGAALEKPICRTPEGSCFSDERHSAGLFWVTSCRESVFPGAPNIPGIPQLWQNEQSSAGDECEGLEMGPHPSSLQMFRRCLNVSHSF